MDVDAVASEKQPAKPPIQPGRIVWEKIREQLFLFPDHRATSADIPKTFGKTWEEYGTSIKRGFRWALKASESEVKIIGGTSGVWEPYVYQLTEKGLEEIAKVPPKLPLDVSKTRDLEKEKYLTCVIA